MSPAQTAKNEQRGWIIPIGGGDKKVRSSPILQRLIELSGGKDARMVIIPTASQLDTAGQRTRDVFKELGVSDIEILNIETRADCEDPTILEQLNLEQKKYAVITLHRPSNVDNLDGLEKILTAFEVIQKDIKLIFPIHPRTRNNLENTHLNDYIKKMDNLILLEPIGYIDFLKLMSDAALVITDSGGIQEETTILGIPCMTLRENTERPVTIEDGTNQLVKLTTENILSVYKKLKSQDFSVSGRTPKHWDGKAAGRVSEIITKHYGNQQNETGSAGQVF
jgi:UDP-N-acetylglucosamine 2-epimerase